MVFMPRSVTGTLALGGVAAEATHIPSCWADVGAMTSPHPLYQVHKVKAGLDQKHLP